MHGYIIHLARSSARRANVEALRAALPFACNVVEAVDGAALTQAERDAAYRPRLHRPRYPFALNGAEIGVFLSHRRAWASIAASGRADGLVLEDDAAIDAAQLQAVLALLEAAPQARPRYILLPPEPPYVGMLAPPTLTAPRVPPARAIAQIVSASAAAALLERTSPFDRPVDSLMQMPWVTGIQLAVARPSGVATIAAQLGG